MCTTWEHYDGKDVTIQAKFKDFDSYQDCVDHLVEQWYKDYQRLQRSQPRHQCW